MKKNQRSLFIKSFFILLLLLLIIIYIIFFSGLFDFKDSEIDKAAKKEAEIGIDKIINNVEQEVEFTKKGEVVTPVVSGDIQNEESDLELRIKSIATIFAERFGSYSSHSNFSNIKDLHIMMTDEMKKWSERYIEDLSNKNKSDAYVGITTKAANSEIQFINEQKGTASVKVVTVRRELGENDDEKFFNQEIMVNLLKVDDEWKVNSAEWQ